MTASTEPVNNQVDRGILPTDNCVEVVTQHQLLIGSDGVVVVPTNFVSMNKPTILQDLEWIQVTYISPNFTYFNIIIPGNPPRHIVATRWTMPRQSWYVFAIPKITLPRETSGLMKITCKWSGLIQHAPLVLPPVMVVALSTLETEPEEGPDERPFDWYVLAIRATEEYNATRIQKRVLFQPSSRVLPAFPPSVALPRAHEYALQKHWILSGVDQKYQDQPQPDYLFWQSDLTQAPHSRESCFLTYQEFYYVPTTPDELPLPSPISNLPSYLQHRLRAPPSTIVQTIAERRGDGDRLQSWYLDWA